MVKWMNVLVIFVIGLLVFANKDYFIDVAAKEPDSGSNEKIEIPKDSVPQDQQPKANNVELPKIRTSESITNDVDVQPKEGVTKSKDAAQVNVTSDIKKEEPAVKEKVVQKIEVKNGMDSRDVSVLLHNFSLVNNTEEFDAYLIKNGYSRSIQVGVYQLNEGMSFEEIAKIITKKS